MQPTRAGTLSELRQTDVSADIWLWIAFDFRLNRHDHLSAAKVPGSGRRRREMPENPTDITRVLNQASQGNPRAVDELFAMVYDDLRHRAGGLMSDERASHTLQRTALVNEAYLKLFGTGVRFQSRLHFFNAAALAMRRILLEHAAAKAAQKRGGGWARISLDDVAPAHDEPPVDLISLDGALVRLKQLSPRQHQVVTLRFFAGLKDAQIAELLDLSEKTVRRDWATARLWLYDQIKNT